MSLEHFVSVSHGLEWPGPYLEIMTDLWMLTSNLILVSKHSFASMVECFVANITPPPLPKKTKIY